MRLCIRLLGLDLLDVELTTDPSAEADGSELAGGHLGSDRIDAGPTDRYLGFTNGREVE